LPVRTIAALSGQEKFAREFRHVGERAVDAERPERVWFARRALFGEFQAAPSRMRRRRDGRATPI
jgi:hypothetical protein